MIDSRDDPTLDESTRLRNRIAELESLVRELRGMVYLPATYITSLIALTEGKPHPRWAEGNFRDGDQSERWHSRAAKYTQAKRSADTEGVDQDTNGRQTNGKLDLRMENNRSPIYDFSSEFQSGVPSPPLLSYDERRHSFGSERPRGPTISFTTPSIPSISYHQQGDSSSSYSNDSSGGYNPSEFDDERFAQRFAHVPSPAPQFCACRTSPAMVHALIPLNHQLQNATTALSSYSNHTHESHCLLYRRIAELNNLMQYVYYTSLIMVYESNVSAMRISGRNARGSPAGTGATYGPGALPTPDTDIMSPLSSASPFDPPSAGHSGQDWSAIAAAGLNPYFPHNPGENGMYSN